jgi:hypothetical protein
MVGLGLYIYRCHKSAGVRKYRDLIIKPATVLKFSASIASKFHEKLKEKKKHP